MPPLAQDPTSGHYYDTQTGYIWDGSNQCYFCVATRQYFAWEATSRTYTPITIAADNASSSISSSSSSSSVAAAKAATFSAADDVVVVDGGTEEIPEVETRALLKEIPPELGAGDDWRNAQERGVVDLRRLACLLCRRRLANLNVLKRHVCESKLHAKNTAERRAEIRGQLTFSQLQALEEMERCQRYQDRAAQRRAAHGQPSRISPQAMGARMPTRAGGGGGGRGSGGKKPIVQPTQAGIPTANKGHRMLRAMGWRHGEGLGRDNKGIVNPVEAATQQVRGAGLGTFVGGGRGTTAAATATVTATTATAAAAAAAGAGAGAGAGADAGSSSAAYASAKSNSVGFGGIDIKGWVQAGGGADLKAKHRLKAQSRYAALEEKESGSVGSQSDG